LVEFEAHYDRYRNYLQTGSWKEAYAPGTGILYNLGSHLIDQALVLFGRPEGVFADIRAQRTGSQVADAFTLLLDYPGLKVTLKAGYLVRADLPRYQLLGTEGSFLKYGLDPQEEALKTGAVPGGPGWGEEPESQWGQLITNLGPLAVQGRVASLPGDYSTYYRQLAAALREGQPLPVTAAQARDVIAVIEAAYESRESGKRVAMG
jgi:predicted dehydrogenase